MLFYSPAEIAALVAAAIVLDWLIGDPRWLPHPVILIGRWIKQVERWLYPAAAHLPAKLRGTGLLLATLVPVTGLAMLVHWLLFAIHPWLAYGFHIWFIASTLAVRGLHQAAYRVYDPLTEGRLPEARLSCGEIVGRSTDQLDEQELTRATVETVAENTVDAFVSPVMYALLGAAPLALMYRATNTLDSMVGYRNARYAHFGWASARFDDVLNWVPARLCGWLMVLVCLLLPGFSPRGARRAIRQFAHLHPSPNSGIPESAVAGALGIELGGLNVYDNRVSERARMGWPLRSRRPADIRAVVRLMYGVSMLLLGGCLCIALIAR